MRPGLLAIALALWVLAAACESTDAGPSMALPDTPRRPLPACEWAQVTEITDGDTIRVKLNGSDERVRYIGIDTPELHAEGGPQPYAEEATEANSHLLEDDRVCLERDVSERDRYGRLLRYVWLADGRMVNEVLVAAGLAESVEYRPDTRHSNTILEPAEAEARAEHRGMWK